MTNQITDEREYSDEDEDEEDEDGSGHSSSEILYSSDEDNSGHQSKEGDEYEQNLEVMVKKVIQN